MTDLQTDGDKTVCQRNLSRLYKLFSSR